MPDVTVSIVVSVAAAIISAAIIFAGRELREVRIKMERIITTQESQAMQYDTLMKMWEDHAQRIRTLEVRNVRIRG
jgi:hypothetical protein